MKRGMQGLLAAALVGAGALMTSVAHAEAPKPSPITPELIAAAKKEGKVVYYAAEPLPLVTQMGKQFEAAYPGITVQVEYAAGEALFQRVMQEYSGGIHNVDTIDSSDASHFLTWKAQGMLAAYVPEVAAGKYPSDMRDPDGTSVGMLTTLMVMAYNTKLVKPEDVPKGFLDLLDPKWKDKLVKAHPAFSGTIMAGTYLVAQKLGWGYYEKLAQQNVLQQQSANDPARIVAQGERLVMADGSENAAFRLMKTGEPIQLIYPVEGTPGVVGTCGVMKDAPHPNAARLFEAYILSKEGQQIFSDGGFRSFNPDVVLTDGRTPLAKLNPVFAPPADLQKAIPTVKANYKRYFGT